MKRHSLNYISRLFLVAAGLACVLNAPAITLWFPYMIGAAMIFAGAVMFLDTFPTMHANPDEKEKYSSIVTRGILIMMLGGITMLKKEDAMAFIGVVWGLLGLIKADRGFTMVMCGSLKERKYQILFAESLVGAVLSFILLFDPIDKIGTHIYILGLEIILYALFKVNTDKKPEHIFEDFSHHVQEILHLGKEHHHHKDKE